MKIRLILSLYALIGASLLSAQVPGYLGKRFILKADFFTTPALYRPTAANRGAFLSNNSNLYGSAQSSVAFNYRFGLEGSYVVSRTQSVSIAADYLKTGAILDRAFSKSLSPFASQSGFDSHYLFYNLTGITADIGYKSFKASKGSIAPMGKYLAYHLSATFVTGEILDKKTSYYSDVSRSHAKLGINPKFILPSFGVEWGNNNIFFDKLVFNYGFRFNMPLNLKRFIRILQGDDAVSINPDYALYNQEQFNDMVTDRLTRHSLFSLRMGVGLLLF
jgi:hypothetical protein